MTGAPANLYTPAQALAWLDTLYRHQTPVAVGYCERLFGRGYGHDDSGEDSARAAWLDPAITDRLRGGAGGAGSGAVWLDGDGNGHIATIANWTHNVHTALVYSPDVVHTGRVNLVPLTYINTRWPQMVFVGSLGNQFPHASGLYYH